MAEVYEKTLKRIKQLKSKSHHKNQKDKDNKSSNVQNQQYQFFQSLLYGTWATKNKTSLKHYNFYTKKSSECVLFLNQSHVQLLTCIDVSMSGVRKYFNMKKIVIYQLHSQYQMDQNLESQKYLILRDKQDEVILLFQSEVFRNKFKENIFKLREFFSKIPNMYDPLILKAFVKADTNQNDEINWQELKYLVRFMKIDLNDSMKSFIKKVLKKQKIQKIYFSDFQRMWKIFYCREQLAQVFQKYNKQKFTTFDDYLTPVLDIKQFRNFLIEQQKQTPQQCNRIIQQVFQNQKTSISFYNFCLYIFGENNNIINDSYRQKATDVSKPLNHYHCYSSHNTYLTGNQLTSSSRVQRYLVDLQNGIRCVEIDVHDGQDCPIVKHGYTLTSAITFEKVIQTIDRFTKMTPNHTPIIISIQNHCNQKNQIKMGEILRQKIARRILLIKTEKQQFPSLQECMGKILIKGPGNFQLFFKSSNKQENVLLQDSCSQDSQEEQEKNGQEKNNNESNSLHSEAFAFKKSQFLNKIKQFQQAKRIIQAKKKIFKKIKQQPTNMHQSLMKYQSSLKNIQQNPKYHHKYKVSSHLLSLITLLSKAKLDNQKNCHWQSISFGQKKILSLFNNPKDRQKIIRLSFIKWFRSYPGGLRFDSSNYDPLPALQLGIQILAVNTQKQDDVNVHILKSFFMKGSNTTPGYRQKLNLSNKQAKNGHDQNLTQQQISKTQNLYKIQITFVSALRIYQNQEDNDIPSVGVEAYFTGTQRDNQSNSKYRKKRQFTDVVERNSFNPKFTKSQTIEIKCRDIELAFFVVEVPQCGRSVIPLQAVKNGWRVISLYDQQLKEKQSKILCKIKVIKKS